MTLQQGVLFGKSEIKVYPCRASVVEPTHANLEPTKLSLFSRKEVLESVKQSLTPFGHAAEADILIEPVTGISLVTRYAVLAVANQEQQSSSPEE